MEKTFTVPSPSDGLALSVTTIVPEGQIRGLVQIAHGMSEHKERYLPAMRILAEHGYACLANDHRGHGASVRTPADLGYFGKDGARAAVDDVHMLTLLFRKEHPGKKLMLFGHSMGSLIVRAYAAAYGGDIDGLIVCGSPGRNSAARGGLLLTRLCALVHGGDHAFSPLLKKLVDGATAGNSDEPNAWLSTNRENRRRYNADPLCGTPFTINGYNALLKLMLAAYAPAKPLRADLPVHFMSGELDPCAPDRRGFDDAVDNFRKRGVQNVTAKMYPGLKHELLNEDVPEIYDDLLDVINRMLL